MCELTRDSSIRKESVLVDTRAAIYAFRPTIRTIHVVVKTSLDAIAKTRQERLKRGFKRVISLLNYY